MTPPAEHCIVHRDATLRECAERFARTRTGVVAFVDEAQRFSGLLTAGDFFRLLAAGVSLDAPVRPHVNTNPVTVGAGTTSPEILRLMTVRGVNHIPVLRPDGTLDRIATQTAILQENLLHNRAVIMAGGEGQRLRPLTDQVPKALIEIDGRPLLEILIERLRAAGILDITLCIRYLGDEIRGHFGDGSAWHVNLDYVEETEPLGTCGGLSLIEEPWKEPVFVLNCDVLSDVDLVSMQRFHALNRAQLTVAVKDHDLEVPFGIVEADHERVLCISEKPRLRFYVNAGIYLLDPEVKKAVPPGRRYDMTELIADLIARDAKVCSFPIRTAWLDVGSIETLRQARESGLGG